MEFFLLRIMDDHSKPEGLEIFYSASEKRFYFMFSLKPVTNSSNICYFKKNDHVSCHVTYGKVYYT